MYCLIILLCLIFSFLNIRSLLVPCGYVSIRSIDCFRLSSFELKRISLITSVKTLCHSLLNVCCVFNISSIFFTISFLSSIRQYSSIFFFCMWFILFLIWDYFKYFLYSLNLRFLFMIHFFVPFAFLSSSLLSFK